MDLVAIAKTVKTRGLRGELIAEILTDFPDRFESVEQVFVVKPDGTREQIELDSFWFQKDRIVLKFVDHDSIESAEKLVNCEICISEDQTVELEEDEFFDWELEGCTIETLTGEKIGEVREVLRTSGTDVLVVKSAEDGEKDFLIPFAETICIETDVENKTIRVDLPEGLLEF